jgi:hypothetical protein
VDEIDGCSGELINRLIELLDNDALGEGVWYDVGSTAQRAVGGRALASTPDTGKEPVPGTGAYELRQHTRLVSRDRWFAQIRDRLFELVASGMFELFLVQSIRDEVRRALAQLADVGTGDRNRAKVRERLERVLADPAERAAFRADRAKIDPSYAELSDDEISALLHRMLGDESFLPTSADAAVGKWAALDNWDEQVALLLSDDVLDAWALHAMLRNR